jgi:hypothetical protein
VTRSSILLWERSCRRRLRLKTGPEGRVGDLKKLTVSSNRAVRAVISSLADLISMWQNMLAFSELNVNHQITKKGVTIIVPGQVYEPNCTTEKSLMGQ